MIEHRRIEDIGGSELDWLHAKHHFALGRYGNPAHKPLGNLYVWNDDEIAPHTGFPRHGHANVEIVTYVREGVITHTDNLGNVGRVQAGDVQVMSAGTGIRHSERNAGSIPTRLFQIWSSEAQIGGEPRWGTRSFPRNDRGGQFILLASRTGRVVRFRFDPMLTFWERAFWRRLRPSMKSRGTSKLISFLQPASSP